MDLSNKHYILTKARDYQAAKENVLKFYKKSMLINYDHIEVHENLSYVATDLEFLPTLEKGVLENNQTISKFIDELKESGIASIDDLLELQQGYHSKLLHIVTHLLDGFISIDSAFYNLVEDSHFLTPSFKEQIVASPSQYWLLRITASFKSSESASLIHVGTT